MNEIEVTMIQEGAPPKHKTDLIKVRSPRHCSSFVQEYVNAGGLIKGMVTVHQRARTRWLFQEMAAATIFHWRLPAAQHTPWAAPQHSRHYGCVQCRTACNPDCGMAIHVLVWEVAKAHRVLPHAMNRHRPFSKTT